MQRKHKSIKVHNLKSDEEVFGVEDGWRVK